MLEKMVRLQLEVLSRCYDSFSSNFLTDCSGAEMAKLALHEITEVS